MKEFFWGCCIALAGPTAQGQVAASSAYPMGYFRNPLDIPMKLAANFGELRTNHFHMGLDIRTEKREKEMRT